MPAFRSKVCVCPGCKKMIAYSPDQEGDRIDCPRCGVKVQLTHQEGPTPDGAPPPLPRPSPAKSRGGRACLFVGGCGCLSAIAVLIGLAILLLLFSHEVPRSLRAACKPLVSRGIVPGIERDPVTLAKTDVDITVTQMSLERPKIYQAVLRQATPTETPMYCVSVVIANHGTTPVTYRTWRRMASESDIQRAATLEDAKGILHGSASFGPETWPVGTQPSTVAQPGESFADVLLFECGPDADTSGVFLLTLPGENLGSSGRLRFRVSCATPQQGR